jgi:DNA topoisomerase-1
MEEKLDLISKNNLTYYDICKEIHEYLSSIEIDSKKMEKQIDDNHSLIYGKNGFVVKTKENSKTVFKAVKSNIDFQNVENFTLEEILDNSNEKMVGTFRNIEIIIKKGKFGPYFNFENKNYSLSSIEKSFEQINIADVISIIQNYNSNEQQSNIIKQLDDNLSIRNGKFGHYLYYKTIKMKKPSFTSLQKCDFDYENTDDISLFYKYIELSKNKNKKKY